jgi:hypothetical protein
MIPNCATTIAENPDRRKLGQRADELRDLAGVGRADRSGQSHAKADGDQHGRGAGHGHDDVADRPPPATAGCGQQRLDVPGALLGAQLSPDEIV